MYAEPNISVGQTDRRLISPFIGISNQIATIAGYNSLMSRCQFGSLLVRDYYSSWALWQKTHTNNEKFDVDGKWYMLFVF